KKPRALRDDDQAQRDAADEFCFEVIWSAVAPDAATGSGAGQVVGLGKILLLATRADALKDDLAESLRRAGYSVETCETDQPGRWLSDGGADSQPRTPEDLAGLVWVVPQVSGSAAAEPPLALVETFLLIQTAQARSMRLPLGVSIVTQGAVAADVGEPCDPVASAVWGLVRSLQNEAPDLGLRLLDVSGTEMDGVARLLGGSAAEPQLALRGSRIMTPRLQNFRPMPESDHEGLIVKHGADASYLITGGLGALGLEAASWLAEQGARHVVLVSRRAPDAAVSERLQGLEAATGCRFVTESLDVSNASAVAALVARFGATEGGWPRLAGVVHAAGVHDIGVLSEQTPDRLTKVWKPKALGAWNLHEATRGLDLDLFVLYGSASAIVGSPGVSGYSAANAFLDGLAALRRSQGLVATNVFWGPWSGGMADDPRAHAYLAREGWRLLNAQDALRALERLLRSGASGGIVVDADFARLSGVMGDHRSQLLSGLIVSPGASVNSDLLRRLKVASAEARQSLLINFLQGELQVVLGLASPPDPTTGFFDLGMDSLTAVEFRNRLTKIFGLSARLPNTLAFDYPSLNKLADSIQDYLRLDTQEDSAASSRSPLSPPVLSSGNDRVAIIGLSCRFPGADDLQAYWRLLLDGEDAVREVPKDRWDLEAYYDPDPEVPGKIYTRRAGLTSGVAEFDPAFFGISPREAVSMDPQQRLLLEASWNAIENANMPASLLRGTRAGVYVGVGPNEYSSLNRNGDPDEIDAYSATGTSLSVTAGRIAYVLGLEGPAVAIDTACSSSLVAVDQACDGLRLGKVDLALAGGVNTVLSVIGMLATSRARMLSPDGLCKTFDASADGYVRGEGCGIVVLKRLSDAERDGDRILAVIRGSAVNQDGASAGLTVPNGPAQQRVIGEALERAGVLPHEVDYLEAHGTGTALGDPIEVRAAAAAYGVGRDASHPLLIGSVKTNIGHLEAAAGIAGLIKAVLSLQHGVIPKHLNFVTPSPRIDWSGLPVKVTSEATPLPAGLGRPWRIGVSSFGFSGTNAHVVLESYGPRPGSGDEARLTPAPHRLVPVSWPEGVALGEGAETAAVGSRAVRVLVLSGKTPGALVALGGRWEQWLAARRAENGEDIAALLADAAFTAGVGRSHFSHRAAIAFSGVDALAVRLAALSAADEAACAAGGVAGVVTGVRNPSAGAARIGFLFTGQGSQWAGMGHDLYESEPVFRAVLERCEAVVRAVRGASLLDVMFARAGATGSLDDTQWTQPGLYALQAGLVALWASLGVKPVAVMGHSVGEMAAAHAAGVLSLEDGLRLALARGSLMGTLPVDGPEAGAMLAVFAPVERVAGAMRDYPDVSLAAENGSHRVVSGPVGPVLALAEELTAEGVRCERLRISHAFHSHLMDPMLGELERVGDGLLVHPAGTVLISNVTGEAVGSQERLDGAYWRKHARSAVAFAQGVKSLAELGVDCLLEVGPHGVLTAMAGLCWPDGTAPRLVASLTRGEDGSASFAHAVGAVYAAGSHLDFAGLFAGEARARIALPGYPFQRQRYWI
ncbi:MAG: SDR family NAD(P)-dependent oxidoreductase, partial [Aestuariivirga sp.]|uniref:SDR family NAD(P)-dependent oxidoreductase n=1 Tax=Aestuariivirga sp. TaxID=2650926 RepID=UPI00301774C0